MSESQSKSIIFFLESVGSYYYFFQLGHFQEMALELMNYDGYKLTYKSKLYLMLILIELKSVEKTFLLAAIITNTILAQSWAENYGIIYTTCSSHCATSFLVKVYP